MVTKTDMLFFVCSADKRKAFRLGTTEVNNNRISFLGEARFPELLVLSLGHIGPLSF